jgi:hypothetical protein
VIRQEVAAIVSSPVRLTHSSAPCFPIFPFVRRTVWSSARAGSHRSRSKPFRSFLLCRMILFGEVVSPSPDHADDPSSRIAARRTDAEPAARL